jgi:hypothetical protein
MESEAGLYDFDLTRFLDANRYPLRLKTLPNFVRSNSCRACAIMPALVAGIRLDWHWFKLR